MRGRVKSGEGEAAMVDSLWGNFTFSSAFQRHLCFVLSPHVHSCTQYKFINKSLFTSSLGIWGFLGIPMVSGE